MTWLALTAWLVTAPALAVTTATADVYDEIAAMAESSRQELGSPGLSIAVAHDGELTYSAGFGLSDVENDVPARATTVYRIASISKPIAATAIMQLVEKGKVSLDDHITKYVPSFPNRDLGLTLRHLMSHTSGIRHYKEGEFDLKDHFDSIEDAVVIFGNDPLLFTPGTQYSYSTYAYNLLAGVVEKASGLTFEAYMKEHVWGPAGMEATGLEHQGELVIHRTRQYVKSGGPHGVRNAPFADLSVKWAGGGMISTAEDLARFAIALDDGKLLTRASLDEMYEPMTLTDGTRMPYGLGWDTRVDDEGRRWIAHGGGATGGSTYILRLPEQQLAVAICTNVQTAGNLRAVAMRVAMALMND